MNSEAHTSSEYEPPEPSGVPKLMKSRQGGEAVTLLPGDLASFPPGLAPHVKVWETLDSLLRLSEGSTVAIVPSLLHLLTLLHSKSHSPD